MPHDLASITDKHQDLATGLGSARTQKLDQLIQNASAAERKEMQQALHFPWYGRGQTTEQTRGDIRQVVSAYLAEGGSAQGAKALRSNLQTMDPAALSALAAQTRVDNGNSLSAIGSQLLKNLDSVAAHDQVTRVLSGLPVDADKATKNLGSSATHVIAYGKDGQATLYDSAQLKNQVKANCVKLGCDPAAAEGLDAMLSNKRALQLFQNSLMLEDVNKPAHAGLSQLLDSNSVTAQADFQSVKKALESLPADVAKAGQPIYADESTALSRDAQGKIQVTNAEVSFTGVKIPEGNKGLSADDVAAIKQQFMDIAGKNYGRAAVPLAFMEHYSKNEAQTPGAGMAAAFKSFNPDSAKLAQDFNSSDCLCQTDALIKKLAENNITAYACGVNSRALPTQKVNGVDVSPEDQNAMSACVTHLDVIVPYVDTDGNKQMLIMNPGMGAEEEYFNTADLPDNDKAPRRIAGSRLSPDGTGLDPNVAQKSAMGYMSSIVFTNSEANSKTKQIAGIDLVKGTVWLNSNASRAYEGGTLDETKNVSFNYREALKNLGGKIDVRMPAANGTYVTESMTNATALVAFSQTLQQQFNLPDNFTKNLVTLMANEQEYQKVVLWEGVQKANGLNQSQQISLAPAVSPAPGLAADSAGKVKVADDSGISWKRTKPSQAATLDLPDDKSQKQSHKKVKDGSPELIDAVKHSTGGNSKGVSMN